MFYSVVSQRMALVAGLQPHRQHQRALWLHSGSPATRHCAQQWIAPGLLLPNPLARGTPSTWTQPGNEISLLLLPLAALFLHAACPENWSAPLLQ